MASDFVDGVVFVDLAPVRDPTLVIPAIASAMGARSGAPTVASLVSALGAASHCLIFLDNFEQVVDAAPVIADLLRHAPTLKILVTSREPLKIGGEWEFQITPLSVVNSALSIEELEQHDAIRLFASRSRAVDRNFALTEDNLKAVSEICRLVDGLPLGIELAAARIKSLPPAALLARLERRLPMLAGERRDMPERQQTMRDAIGWSYQILSPSEQNLFRWLGVFAGGFTLEAIESITSSMAGDGIDTLADLSSLVDKCLVQASSGRSADLRYQMLETIREFAAEQLAASDDYRAVRDAHAAWFTRVAADRRRQGIGWAERRLASNTPSIFEVEYSNIRAALVWFDETDNLGGLARLAGAIYWYWVFHGPRMEGLRWLRRASHLQPETITDKTSRMWALEGLGLMARNAGEFDEASNAVEECLTLAQELGDETAGALALAFLSFIGLARGEYDESDALTVAAIDRFTHLVPDWPIGGVIAHRGLAAFGKRDLDRAAQHFGEAIDASRSIGDRFNVAINLGYLSVVRSEQGRYQEAASLLGRRSPSWRISVARRVFRSSWLTSRSSPNDWATRSRRAQPGGGRGPERLHRTCLYPARTGCVRTGEEIPARRVGRRRIYASLAVRLHHA